jgi:hypothetical protein
VAASSDGHPLGVVEPVVVFLLRLADVLEFRSILILGLLPSAQGFRA